MSCITCLEGRPNQYVPATFSLFLWAFFVFAYLEFEAIYFLSGTLFKTGRLLFRSCSIQITRTFNIAAFSCMHIYNYALPQTKSSRKSLSHSSAVEPGVSPHQITLGVSFTVVGAINLVISGPKLQTAIELNICMLRFWGKSLMKYWLGQWRCRVRT